MKKKLFFLAIAVVAVGFAIWWRASLDTSPTAPAFTDEELSKRMAEMHGTVLPNQASLEKISMDKRVRVAIGGMGLAGEQSAQISDLVLTELSNAKGLEFIERQSLDLALREVSLSVSSLVRARDAVRVGKILRADWFVLGSATRLSGANSIVVRIVDGRTGILRDAGVFAADQGATQLAVNLAEFIRQSRENAASTKSRVYLAIGSFEDLSLNNRRAALPVELRSYLTAAFQGANVTLLERESVNILLQEVRLDLAGLTEGAAINAPVMQSAYWMVDGFYQSYETSEFEVELVLNVRRMFGRNQQIALREKPGEKLFQRVKESIDGVMQRDKSAVSPTRLTELQAQMEIGKELLLKMDRNRWIEHVWVPVIEDISRTEAIRRRRNTEEAIRAFETVLLLDPSMREAKVCLATCLRKSFVGRTEKARDIYREIIESPDEDKWTDVARKALVASFRWSGGDEKKIWFERALAQTATPSVAKFYREQVEIGADDVVLEQGESSESARVAEKRLFEAIQSSKSVMDGKLGIRYSQFGIYDFMEAFGTNHAAAALNLVQLLPRMKKEFPDLTPHLLASVVVFQTDTNAPVIGEFQEVVRQCSEQPERVFKIEEFWMEIKNSVWDWAYKRKLYGLAASLLEQLRIAASQGHANDFDDQQKIKLGYTYLNLERWNDALKIFQSYSNRPIATESSGPWGRAFTPVLTGELADECREKLGIALSDAQKTFNIQTNIFCLHCPSAFAIGDSGVWIGISNQLTHLNFELQTNRLVKLPGQIHDLLTAVCVGESNVWVGTEAAGLIEYEKTSGQCRTLTVEDGLLMNSISGLHHSPGILWIGFQNGLGQLDLQTRGVKSFMPRLNPDNATRLLDPPDGPPRGSVRELVTSFSGDLWFWASRKGIQRHRLVEKTWETLPNETGTSITSFAADSERIIQGLRVSMTKVVVETKPEKATTTNASLRTTLLVTNDELMHMRTNKNSNQRIVSSSGGDIKPKAMLKSYTVRDGRWENLLYLDALPAPPTAMALDGADLWVGGEGFLAVVDTKRKEVRRLRYIPARNVERIQVGGGYVWAQFDKHLHRVSLADTR